MKNYYYVGITSNDIMDDTIRYVYKVDNANKTAYWETYKELRVKYNPPLKFSLSYAKQLAQCLRINGYNAFVITTTIDFK